MPKQKSRSRIKIMSKRCSQCLFSNNKIVNNKAKEDVLKRCDKQEKYFECHLGTMNNEAICCRGYYDARPTMLLFILGRHLDLIDFVDPKIFQETSK